MNNENQMIHVLPFDKERLSFLRDVKIIVYATSIDTIGDEYKESLHDKEVIAMVVNMPLTSISDVQWSERWEPIPLIIKAYNVGDYYNVLRHLTLIRKLNVRIFLSNSWENVFSDLKFLASLGIDCGLTMDGCRMNDEKLLDFSSYYYLSQGRHATVEPFEFILRHLRDEQNIDFSTIYFTHPLLFIQDDMNVADKMNTYYSHFMNLDECAICPAFKICNHNMQNILDCCSSTMNEIFEMAEIKYKINNQVNPQKTICQL
jgi:hypothetical protein